MNNLSCIWHLSEASGSERSPLPWMSAVIRGIGLEFIRAQLGGQYHPHITGLSLKLLSPTPLQP